ncbi:MAG: hypothetical protein GF308_21820, partial [Candidatus Heimdallarchaeota archaeon]|nr:hypothetical protein [Candidatus Heimdallarchaeota archaeon]MBD3193288.1 hypothetical protein [Candidatus Heimdallarchaeota archaeon]
MSNQLRQRKKIYSKTIFGLLVIILVINSTLYVSRKATVTAEISVPMSQRTVGLSYVGRFLEGYFIDELFTIEEKELAVVQCNSKISLLNISNPEAPF